ncbi:hypothetical protein H0B56_17635 [Haloechinothrix sp. YIM 98757]|uniref:Uncharacterized protein n=1 Tax=Haloechinothrix aidingensis TaxID=2752311 RepID=A0A838ADT4_9PSEU|nr:hypothetical protein [Haloechinothrix aidingensis]MBA0127371.1 hypothetical protein [Haloechinothrix aidingensis]
MHGRSLRLSAMLLACALPALAAAPAGADAPPTDGHAVGHAGTAFGLARVLSSSIPADSILTELDDVQADDRLLATDNGVGLTSARANSTSSARFERAMAQAAPHGSATEGASTIPRPVPGTLLQTALEDNEEPRTGDIEPSEPPAAILARTGDLEGSVHARWSEATGPCVDPIAEADLEAESVALGSAVFTLPDIPLRDLDLPFPDGYEPEGTLGTLGGLLAGTDPPDGVSGSLVSMPDGLSSRSRVTLSEPDDEAGTSAVTSTSTLEGEDISVLASRPVGLDLDVAREPELTATSTGDAETSEIDYRHPEIEGSFEDEPLFELDEDDPRIDIPIGVPTEGFEDLSAHDDLGDLPIVGGVAADDDGAALPLPSEADEHVTDLFILRLSIAGLDERTRTDDLPFPGHHLGASARLLDVQLLPTEALAEALLEQGIDPPSTLAQHTIGEQVASAYAPEGGVVCAPTDPGPVPSDDIAQLAGPAYSATPISLGGAAALLAGVALVITAGRRGPGAGRVPTPRPRA